MHMIKDLAQHSKYLRKTEQQNPVPSAAPEATSGAAATPQQPITPPAATPTQTTASTNRVNTYLQPEPLPKAPTATIQQPKEPLKAVQQPAYNNQAYLVKASERTPEKINLNTQETAARETKPVLYDASGTPLDEEGVKKYMALLNRPRKPMPEAPKVPDYEEMLRLMRPENLETPEGRRLRERRERNRAAIAAAGDALAALANLGVAYGYGNDQYDPNNAMTPKIAAQVKAYRQKMEDMDKTDRAARLKLAELKNNDAWKRADWERMRAEWDDRAKDKELEGYRWGQQMGYKRNQDREAQSFREREFEERKRQNRIQNGLARERLNIARQNAENSRKSGADSGMKYKRFQQGDRAESLSGVAASNWQNDKYVLELFNHLKGTIKTTKGSGLKQLWRAFENRMNNSKSEEDMLAPGGMRGSVRVLGPSEKAILARQAIEEAFKTYNGRGYNAPDVDKLSQDIMLFESRYPYEE